MATFFNRYQRPLTIGGITAALFVLVYVAVWPSVLSTPSQGSLPASVNAALEEFAPQPAPLPNYIEIVQSCDIHYEGDCVVARRAATTSASVITKLRTGIVLRVATTTITDQSGRLWYHVIFDEAVRYPERLAAHWYIAAENVRAFYNEGQQDLIEGAPIATSTKHILINRSLQMLYAYDGETLFMETPISTGLDLTPTPRGIFHVYRKIPTRYMQGPLPGISGQYYDLPGVSWNLYFTYQGGAIHGTYWHNSFGKEWSHGCVNLPTDAAQKLYEWAPLGIEVLVRD